MSPLLIALLGVLLVPLFIGTWRAALVGLAAQGLLMAWITYRLDWQPGSPGYWVELFDLAVIRGAGIPLVFYRALRGQQAPARNDAIPPNLLSWTLALTCVLVSFSFAGRVVEAEGDAQTLVAVACAGLLLGFLTLATQADRFSQITAVLRIENAIALFELGSGGHDEALPVRLGQIAVLLATVTLFRLYMVTSAPAERRDSTGAEAPTL